MTVDTTCQYQFLRVRIHVGLLAGERHGELGLWRFQDSGTTGDYDCYASDAGMWMSYELGARVKM